MITNVTVTIDNLDELVRKRGLQAKGEVQRYIDSEVLRQTDPYVPMDTGNLKNSGVRHTVIGSGEVRYRTPYAKRLYYNPQFTFQGAPLRGGKWFERMKADKKDAILKGAAKIAGARGER